MAKRAWSELIELKPSQAILFTQPEAVVKVIETAL